jgi:hypothetical protein
MLQEKVQTYVICPLVAQDQLERKMQRTNLDAYIVHPLCHPSSASQIVFFSVVALMLYFKERLSQPIFVILKLNFLYAFCYQKKYLSVILFQIYFRTR